MPSALQPPWPRPCTAVATNPDGQRTTTVYDITGAVSKTVDAASQPTTMLHDVLYQVVGYINGLGQTASQVLDALGRTVVNIDAGSKVLQSLFDQNGQNSGTIDGLGDQTRADFDAAGRTIR